MPEPTAFLSYTRKDDEFFGGYITAFRTSLENAVHVVTGDPSFRVFQDVEGIVVGEDWRNKLSEVIHGSSFLVPMLSPLFFNSEACRDELGQFLEHERALRRRDLILPVYFLSCPKLEKPDERAKDPFAKEIATRQLFDWRENANVPLHDPASRAAILKLAGGVGQAIERLETAAPTARPARLGPEQDLQALAGDPRLDAGVEGRTARGQLSPRAILWVDDAPDNNRWERQALEAYGMVFVLARDTEDAERALRERGPFAAVISDMGRVGDRQAGLTLLDRLRKAGVETPYFIYTSGLAAKLGPLARLRGAQGLTANPDALVEMVVAAVR
jgi:CheY-like chemotaxis protein